MRNDTGHVDGSWKLGKWEHFQESVDGSRLDSVV